MFDAIPHRYEELKVSEMVLLKDAVKMLPGFMPRNAIRMLFDAWEENPSGDWDDTVTIGKRKVTLGELSELMISNVLWNRLHVSPEGAHLLLELYREGSLPLKRKNQALEERTELDAYADI